MTTLTFPNVEDFVLYLIEHKIGRMGLVAMHRVEPSSKGMGWYIEQFTLTSIRYLDAKSIAKELLTCELPYYRDIFVTIEHNSEEARGNKAKVLKQITDEIERICKEKKYLLQTLNCKFDK